MLDYWSFKNSYNQLCSARPPYAYPFKMFPQLCSLSLLRKYAYQTSEKWPRRATYCNTGKWNGSKLIKIGVQEKNQRPYSVSCIPTQKLSQLCWFIACGKISASTCHCQPVYINTQTRVTNGQPEES